MASPQFVVRQAGADELGTVMALLKERIEWLRARGSDQWSTWESWRVKIHPALEGGNVWLLLDGADPVGTISVEFQGDRDFWDQEECAEPAAYLSKLAIRLDHAGQELGVLLTDWASDYAYRRGCKFVRLDAWKTNEGLHAYYVDRGWKHLRTVDAPGRNSGSLFQLPVRPMRRAQRTQLQEALPYIVLGNTRGGPEINEPDPAGNWHANHVHRGGMRVKYTVLENPSEAMSVDFMRYRLRNEPGAGWQLDAVDRHFTNWRYQGVVLAMDAQLNEDSTYILTHQELADDCRMVAASVPTELATACVPRPQTTSGGDQ